MWFARIAILFGLLCGLGATQLPEFAQQYRQRLGGAVDELERVLARFDQDAAAQGLNRAGGVRRLESNPDPLAEERGADIVRVQAREARLSQQLQDMNRAGPIGRMAALVQGFDSEVAERALANFTPAIPVTPESVVTGLIGFLVGFLFLHGVAWPVRRRRRLAARRASVQGL